MSNAGRSEMTSKLANLVLASRSSIDEQIDLLKAMKSSPLDLQRSVNGVFHGQQELCRSVRSLDDLSGVDLGRRAAWKVRLHCNGSKFGSVRFKFEITRFRPRMSFSNDQSQKRPSAVSWVCLHVVTRSLALCGGGLVLLIGWACRQLETCSSSYFSNLLVGLKQASGSVPKGFPPM